MRLDDCYQLGEVIKTHGLHGEVAIHLDVDFPDDYKNLESVFLEQQGKLVPFFVESIQINKDKALILFEDISSIDEAKALVKQKLFLPLKSLPNLSKGQYYFHDLIGCDVFENKQCLGQIKSVIDLSGNELLSVDMNGNELLIPLKEEIVQKVDIAERKVVVILPDGLLDIYKE